MQDFERQSKNWSLKRNRKWKRKQRVCREFVSQILLSKRFGNTKTKIITLFKQSGSRIKRFRTPERSNVDGVRLKWFKQQVTVHKACLGGHLLFLQEIITTSLVYGEGLRPLACWDHEFESRRGHGCLSFVSVVYHCDELTTRPGEFYRLWCVTVWSRSLKNEAAQVHVGLLRQGRKNAAFKGSESFN
jgi:hypothetical protein